MMMNNPNYNEKNPENNANKYLFPLHRIKSIMKQDTYFTPKA
jgi:hypothetical protein